MPASFGLECPHLHCTRVHNKGLQMPTSSCARAQFKIRAPKKCPRLPPLACVQEDTRVGLFLRVPKMAMPAWTRAKMHASPLLPALRRCARLGGYGASTESSLPPIFQPRSPHDQEQCEEGVWL